MSMLRLDATSFGVHTPPESQPPWKVMAADEGSVVVTDGDDVIGTALYLDLEMTVPGGARLPVAGVSAVAVAPTHRRRGVLRALYTELHQRIADAGYPIAGLTASEGGIYGRFEYGPATVERSLSVQRRFAVFHDDAPDVGGVRLIAAGEHRDQMMEIYERWRLRTPGGLACPPALWDDLLADREADRNGGSAWYALLHPDGCALYRVHRGDSMEVRVEAMTAVTPQAHAALWRTLLGLDLMEKVHIDTHPADPLPYLLVDSRQVRTTAQVDALWLRIMDIPAALQARTYLADVHVVIDVVDRFRRDGGRFAVDITGGHAQCVPTDAPFDLQMNLDVLGSIYLGTHTVRELAAANRIRCATAELLMPTDLAFGSAVPAELGFHF